MLVHIAESGRSFELDCGASAQVEEVQAWLAQLTGVAVHHQLLICGEIRLHPPMQLAFYSLPSEGCPPLFLFNRTRLAADATPSPEEFQTIEPEIPPLQSTSHTDHPLDAALDPALKALPSYEIQFQYHLQKGHAIFIASQKTYDTCRRLLREQQVQCMAMDTARGNRQNYHKTIDRINKFMRDFDRQRKQHEDLLTHFERDLERLRSYKLHPALVSKNCKTLLDFVKEGQLRESVDNCRVSHKQFQLKVSLLKNRYEQFERDVNDLFHDAPLADVKNIEERINRHASLIEEEGSVLQSLSKDVNTVKKLVDECVSSEFSASLRPHDAVSALGSMYDFHDNHHLPNMEACLKKLSSLLEFCQLEKLKMNLRAHVCIRKVAALQSSLKDLRNQLSIFTEAMARQEENFFDLKKLRRISPAYKACLAEVIRRRSGMRLYMGEVSQLAEELALQRELEVSRRKEFLRLQSTYIPKDILEAMGLFDVPSQCVIDIKPFDNNLLNIDVKDLEMYATEFLAGSFVKALISGSVSSCANDALLLSCGEDSTVAETKGELGKESIDEVSSGEEIAGTSKLEVENAWLKSELASAIALLGNLHPDLDGDESSDAEECGSGKSLMKKTATALRLKDEYAEHLQKMLKSKLSQCSTYEKRICELEWRLSDQKAIAKPELPLERMDNVPLSSEAVGYINEGKTPYSSCSAVESMDRASSSTMEDMRRDGPVEGTCGRFEERADETVREFSGNVVMAKIRRDYPTQTSEISSDSAYVEHRLSLASSDVVSNKKEDNSLSKGKSALTVDQEELSFVQETLVQRTTQLAAVEDKLNAALEDVAALRRELEGNLELLRESQMNCAHLENLLHQAWEEAQSNLYAAEGWSSEYNALRSSSVKLQDLVERLHRCISIPLSESGGFADSLHVFADSLRIESRDDEIGEFRALFCLLAERVQCLARQHMELFERCRKAEATQTDLAKESDNAIELLGNFGVRHNMETQLNPSPLSVSQISNEGFGWQERPHEEPLVKED